MPQETQEQKCGWDSSWNSSPALWTLDPILHVKPVSTCAGCSGRQNPAASFPCRDSHSRAETDGPRSGPAPAPDPVSSPGVGSCYRNMAAPPEPGGWREGKGRG